MRKKVLTRDKTLISRSKDSPFLGKGPTSLSDKIKLLEDMKSNIPAIILKRYILERGDDKVGDDEVGEGEVGEGEEIENMDVSGFF